MAIVLCVFYFAVLLVLSMFGLHRMHLVLLCRRHRDVIESAPALVDALAPPAELPRVTIQLPIFNESTVVARLLRMVAKMDYPRDRLEIQVLDDSTDETQVLAKAEVERLQARGFDAVYIHRENRLGYKAGALENGLRHAKGELVGMFDADFLPRPDFVRALVGHFRDPKVGMVQARWAHLNRDVSLLTKVQALMLDGHHLVENRARFGAGLFFNFSGTGGIWRKAAIVDAGGWQHDTLTEDLDLSYRAQLRGWKFVYRRDVISPAELPEDISALRAQQHRWAKGTVQTARKLLRKIWSAKLSRMQRVEALFHLTPHFAYPLMVLLTFLLLPVLLTVKVSDPMTMVLFDMPLCMAPMSSLAAFYMLAESVQGRSRWSALKMLPVLIAMGTGLAPHLTAAVHDGLRTTAGEFVRTPKHGTDRWRYFAGGSLPITELLCAIVTAASFVVAIQAGHFIAAPFAALFTVGYLWVAYLIVAEQIGRRRQAAQPEATPVSLVAQAAAEPQPAEQAYSDLAA
jgi:cellulose synthase/poly-beta-1,6-N-acetylglucosamine synthase-like glycosyltransferase